MKEPYAGALFSDGRWLTAVSAHPETLRVLLNAEAGKDDQADKDLALIHAAGQGKLESVRILIADGANPNVDLSELIMWYDHGDGWSTQETGVDGWWTQEPGVGSVLIYAAHSGNPEVVKEILRYHPKLETRDRKGRTAIFTAAEYRERDADGARVECVRLLGRAGANVNARDNDGNTPLHETSVTDVEEELLKLGADVDARNKNGETPIFTTVDEKALPLFIEHGADLTIRNGKGETVMEAARKSGPARAAALRKAILESTPR
jgi:ankyrin repeat protein